MVPEPVLCIVRGVPDDLVGWVVPAVSRNQSQGCGVFDDCTEDRCDATDGKDALKDGQDACQGLRHELRATTNKTHDEVQSRVTAEGVELIQEPHLCLENQLDAARAVTDCHNPGRLALRHEDHTRKDCVSVTTEDVALSCQDKEWQRLFET